MGLKITKIHRGIRFKFETLVEGIYRLQQGVENKSN